MTASSVVIRRRDRAWVLPRRQRCACYGTHEPTVGKRFVVVSAWRFERGYKVCARCGLPLRVWHWPVEVLDMTPARVKRGQREDGAS